MSPTNWYEYWQTPTAYNTYFAHKTIYGQDDVFSIETQNGDDVNFKYKLFFTKYDIRDATIEAWFRPSGSDDHKPLLGLRTNTVCSNDILNPQACSGYFLKLDDNNVKIEKIVSGGSEDVLGLPVSIGNMRDHWFHVKFEVNGINIKGWATQDEIFSETPTISATDTTFSQGRAGFGGRILQTGSLSIDNIWLSSSSYVESYSFEV